MATAGPNALVDALIASLSRRQSPSGLFPHARLIGDQGDIEGSPFGATFVAHALSRIRPALEPEQRARVDGILERTVAALRRAPDPDGRVRFFGPGSSIRPDVDDTACVWSALIDAGDACPPGVLDAIEGSAVRDGGFANDFDTMPPAAVELASSMMALALLQRCGRDSASAKEYVDRKVSLIEFRGLPFGFFFPSRFYAAFVVVRANIDFGAQGLTGAAMQLGKWIASVAKPEGPLLERAFALWVLEATEGPRELREALRRSCVESHPASERPDPWFTSDPRSLENTGLELFGCTAVAEAVLLDALVLPHQPNRHSAAPEKGEGIRPGVVRRPRARTNIRRVGDRDGAGRFEVTIGETPVFVEVVKNAPGVRAYRCVGAWAVRYSGADTTRGAAAADALIDAGIDARMTERLADDAGGWNIELIDLEDAPFMSTVGIVRRAQREATERGRIIRGLPLCLGGPVLNASPVPDAEPCRSCLDAGSCDTPSARWIAAHGTTDLRPRRSDESLADLLRFLAHAEMASPQALEDVAALRAAVSDPRQAEIELSFKAEGDTLIEGPRVTFYQHQPDVARVLDTFAALAGATSTELANRLRSPCEGLPLHVGSVHGSAGRSIKLYVRTESASGPRHREVLDACAPGLRLDGLESAWIHGIGVAVGPARERIRLYVVKERNEADDPRADSHALEGWDLSEDASPALESRYVHYRAAHLGWLDAAKLAGFGPELTTRLGKALTRSGRWYARFLGLPKRSRARSLYVTLGPRVPRYEDDGP